ncbi:hypothetical protein ZWY2020_056751 [Hordeum vulgare]|nr:hypothetical protein ZWY2020_056751 [Hordeum vulgare]
MATQLPCFTQLTRRHLDGETKPESRCYIWEGVGQSTPFPGHSHFRCRASPRSANSFQKKDSFLTFIRGVPARGEQNDESINPRKASSDGSTLRGWGAAEPGRLQRCQDQGDKDVPVHSQNRLQIGQELTGFGCGGNPDIGMNAAKESCESIEEALHGADMVFVTGRRRAVQAQEGIAALRNSVDTLIVIPNDKLLSAVSPNTPVMEAFNLADDILWQGIRGISDIITVPGLVNVDFADVRAIMQNAGSSLMGIGTATGKSRARDAALNAIQSPLLDIGIERATGIVWNITGGTDLTLFEVNAAAEVIYDLVDPNANLIFGSVIDPSLNGQVSITLIATGFKRQDEAEGRTAKGGQQMQGDNGRDPSSTGGSKVEIPEFLRKRGPSRFLRI